MAALQEKLNPIGNRLLAALPHEEKQRLLSTSQIIRLPRNRIVYEAEDEIRSAYFLLSGMVSLLAITEDGWTVDICTIGPEGLVGIPIVLNRAVMPCRVITQLPCEALMIWRTALLAEFNRAQALRAVLLKYVGAQQAEIIQSAVCHSLHTIKQRLCRWLLVLSDSVESQSFDVTKSTLPTCWGISATASRSPPVSCSSKDSLSMGVGT